MNGSRPSTGRIAVADAAPAAAEEYEPLDIGDVAEDDEDEVSGSPDAAAQPELGAASLAPGCI